MLPAIPTSAQLQEAIRRMTPTEAEQAFRHRLVPISWAPGETTFVAAGERAKAYASEQGLTVSAITSEHTLLRELQRGRESELIHSAVWGLCNRFPDHSAAQPFTAQQALWLVFGLAFVVFAAFAEPLTSAVTGFAVMLGLFALSFGFTIWCLLPARLPRSPPSLIIADDELPVYSLLIPLLDEAAIADQTLCALEALDYPKAKLDIKIIIEAGDDAVRKFLEGRHLPQHMEVLAVPKSAPRTRPKALNYALAFARGDLVAVYDVESTPAPDQLRRLAGTFALAPKTVACLQTQLLFHNRRETWLTRQQALEQAFTFRLLFPKLAKFGAPLLFTGASSHYRTALLRQVGGFDPHNLARDGGLGLRLARAGLRTALASTQTREEAALRLKDWMGERVRWIMGALQTTIVNFRTPIKLWRDLGARNLLLTQLLTSISLIVALLHPIFFAWVASTAVRLSLHMEAGPRLWLFLESLYGIIAILSVIAALASAVRATLYLGRGPWIVTVVTLPIYWLLISLASWLALLRFFFGTRPRVKAAHGLSRARPEIDLTKRRKSENMAGRSSGDAS